MLVLVESQLNHVGSQHRLVLTLHLQELMELGGVEPIIIVRDLLLRQKFLLQLGQCLLRLDV